MLKCGLQRTERLHLRETLGKVPPLVREWHLQEKLGGFYDSSLKPHIERLGTPKHPDAIADLDMLVARGPSWRGRPTVVMTRDGGATRSRG